MALEVCKDGERNRRGGKMVALVGVATQFFGGLSRVRDYLRIPYRARMVAAMDGNGNNTDGSQHGGLPVPARSRNNGGLPRYAPPNVSKRAWIEPVDILGGIALIGLFIYAWKYGMNRTMENMLIGLFGMLFGRSTKSNEMKL